MAGSVAVLFVMEEAGWTFKSLVKQKDNGFPSCFNLKLL